ncbi:MAG: tRNA (guanosine(37)-N1)-methyltransferase TrmD [Pseudomonadota bacterium]
MDLGVVTLFPEMFNALTENGITGRAFQKNLARLHIWNPRDFTTDIHRTVDDRPYGGGPGMVLKPEPISAALQAARHKLGAQTPIIYLTPQGKTFNQNTVNQWSQVESLILLCGRYEGIDERIIHLYVDEEWSIGDYVISGGELAAMVVFDALVRTLDGACGDPESIITESFSNPEGLDWPHFTRPVEFEGLRVPDVLTSGDHAAIERWRRQQAREKTALKKPEWVPISK